MIDGMSGFAFELILAGTATLALIAVTRGVVRAFLQSVMLAIATVLWMLRQAMVSA